MITQRKQHTQNRSSHTASASEITNVVISNQRFKSPLLKNDAFHPLRSVLGDLSDLELDLTHFQSQTAASARARAQRVRNRSKIQNLNLAETIWSLLTLNRYRRGNLGLSETARWQCLRQLTASIENKLPIDLTFAFFPIKIRNPLKTFAQIGTEVDIGELGCLLRLSELCQSIQHLYVHGARFLVSCDGYRYQSIHGLPGASIQGYRRNVQAMIDFLGAGDQVKLFDERTLYPAQYEDVLNWNVRRIHKLYAQGDNKITSLINTLRPNIALVMSVDPQIPLPVVALAFASDIGFRELKAINRDAYDLRRTMSDRSLGSTIEYIAANWTMLDLQVFASALPLAVKTTVHPKHGEIGIYPINKATDNVFPHNGQGHMSFSRGKLSHIDKIRTSFAIDLMRRNSDNQLCGVILPPDKYPFSDGKHPFSVVCSMPNAIK